MKPHPADNTPKLLVLCQLFYPELISTGQTLTELCEELADMGVDIKVVCGPPTIVDRKTQIPNYIEYRGIRIKRVWGTRFPKFNILGNLINQVTFAFSSFIHLLRDASKAPVLVLTNPPFLGIVCALLQMVRKKPYIYLIFDVYPDTAVKLGLLKKKSLLVRIWNRANTFVFKRASTVVVIGRCMKDIIMEKMKSSDVDFKNKIRMLHLWTDDRLIQPVTKEKNPFTEKWNLKGKFVLIYSGNMSKFHDMETIMKTANALIDYKDIVFLFIGEGYKKPWMTEYAAKHQLTNCQFHTYVDREELKFSLSCADIGLVSLQEGHEGLSVPSKVFGLMAAGLPVIAITPQSSEVARIVMEEECGLVVKPGDVKGLTESILNLYNDRQKLKLMGKNARQAIDTKYSLRSAAKSYFEIITSTS